MFDEVRICRRGMFSTVFSIYLKEIVILVHLFFVAQQIH